MQVELQLIFQSVPISIGAMQESMLLQKDLWLILLGSGSVRRTFMRGDQTDAWQSLTALSKAFFGFDLRDAFASDATRAAHFSQEAPGVFADLSKNHWDAVIEAQLIALADQAGVLKHRDRMFNGEAINATENRAVMHWLLRHPAEGAAADARGARPVHAHEHGCS